MPSETQESSEPSFFLPNPNSEDCLKRTEEVNNTLDDSKGVGLFGLLPDETPQVNSCIKTEKIPKKRFGGENIKMEDTFYNRKHKVSSAISREEIAVILFNILLVITILSLIVIDIPNKQQINSHGKTEETPDISSNIPKTDEYSNNEDIRSLIILLSKSGYLITSDVFSDLEFNSDNKSWKIMRTLTLTKNE